jgi:ABC-type nitrate/sulfonate/bicarbonate transport system substrate-binding protein
MIRKEKPKHRRLRLLIVITVSLAVTIALTVFAIRHFRAELSGSSGHEKISLRLQWLHQAQFAGFYIAKEKGFYADEGLDVTINPGGQDFNAATLVASGSDDVGIWTADQVMLSYSRGMPLRALGTVFSRSLTAFMVTKESGITKPKDFEGKTVGIYYGYDSETIYVHLLKKYGVDRSKIKETALQYDLSRFFSGEVDVWPAYVINQPLTAKKAGVEVNVLTPDQFGVNYYSDTIIVNEKTLRNKHDEIVKFMRASELGWRYALDHRDEAVDVVMKTAPHLDREVQRMMLDVVAQYIGQRNPMFAMDRDVWNSIANILTEQGLLKEAPNLDEMLDASMVVK